MLCNQCTLKNNKLGLWLGRRGLDWDSSRGGCSQESTQEEKTQGERRRRKRLPSDWMNKKHVTKSSAPWGQDDGAEAALETSDCKWLIFVWVLTCGRIRIAQNLPCIVPTTYQNSFFLNLLLDTVFTTAREPLRKMENKEAKCEESLHMAPLPQTPLCPPHLDGLKLWLWGNISPLSCFCQAFGYSSAKVTGTKQKQAGTEEGDDSACEYNQSTLNTCMKVSEWKSFLVGSKACAAIPHGLEPTMVGKLHSKRCPLASILVPHAYTHIPHRNTFKILKYFVQ